MSRFCVFIFTIAFFNDKFIMISIGSYPFPEEQEKEAPAHRAGLPGKAILFYIVPLDCAYKARLAGHVPASKFFRLRLKKT